jgi:hypothetical protein
VVETVQRTTRQAAGTGAGTSSEASNAAGAIELTVDDIAALDGMVLTPSRATPIGGRARKPALAQ